MHHPSISVTIIAAAGPAQRFLARHASLDCGHGSTDIHPGNPTYFRDFEYGVLTLIYEDTVTTITIAGGVVACTGGTLCVLCERATTVPCEEDCVA